jgi:hypothetical protein
MATVELPAGTVWMEWEYKTSEATVGHYPGVLIDDVTVTTGRIVAGPPTSHVSGMSTYYSNRAVQVPVSMSDADRISLYYRTGNAAWTMYVDGSHPTGLFDSSPITFQAPGDGRYEVFSIASNETYSEPIKTAAEASFTIDTVYPTVSISSPTPSSIFGSGTVKLEWTSGDVGTGVAFTSVSVDGGTWTNVTGTSYTIRSLTDGTHAATVQVTDRANHFVRASVTFAVDLSAPTMIVSPTGDDVARDSVVTVSFQDEVDKASVSITVNGVPGSLSWNGNEVTFLPSALLAPRTTYEATVSGKDIDGDAFSESWSFTTLEDRGSISGTVRDGDGAGIGNAMVRLSNGMTMMTDGDGDFTFADVPSGHYTLSVTKDGYMVMTEEVDVTATQTNEMGSLSLKAVTGVPIAYYEIIALSLSAIVVIGAIFILRRKR